MSLAEVVYLYIPVALFGGATIATARHSRMQSGMDTALVVGFLMATIAAILRIPHANQAMDIVFGGAAGDVARQIVLMLSGLAMAAWVRFSVAGRRSLTVPFLTLGGIMSLIMIAAWAISGPWERDVLLNFQPGSSSGVMVAYWASYYLTMGTAFASYGVSSVISVINGGLRKMYMMIFAAVGSLAGVSWVVTSSLAVFFGFEFDDSIVVVFAALFIVVGSVGHMLLTGHRNRRTRALAFAFHNHVSGVVAETRLPTSNERIQAYHSHIQTLDALAALSRFADRSDASLVERVAGVSDPDLLRVYQVDAAIARRGMDQSPMDPDDWGGWLSDADAVQRVARAFRDRSDAHHREMIMSEIEAEA